MKKEKEIDRGRVRIQKVGRTSSSVAMEGKPLPDAVRQRESGFPGSEDKVQRSQRTAYASRYSA